MGTQKNRPMSLQRDADRKLRSSIHATQAHNPGQGGKPRMIDISETGEYRKVTITMSPQLKKRFDLAVAATETTQVEFVISAIEPKIEDALASLGI